MEKVATIRMNDPERVVHAAFALAWRTPQNVGRMLDMLALTGGCFDDTFGCAPDITIRRTPEGNYEVFLRRK